MASLRSLPALLASSLACLFVSGLSAAPYVHRDTDLRELPLSANGHRYVLYIGLPAAYSTEPTRTFPTLYFPDAYWDFTQFLTSVGNLRVDQAVPDMLLVGIGYAGESPDVNALRALDLTPGVDSFFDPTGQRTGRADEFLSVIANEIIPFVQREYRADPTFRVLAGNSFGGLFTTYAAFERPGLFQGYLASSSSLWWRNRSLHARESVYAQSNTSFNARIFFGYASDESAQIVASTRELFSQMRTRSYSGLALAIREMEGERHSSTKAEAYTRGLRFLFAPLAPNPALRATSMRSNVVAIATRGRVGVGDDVMIAGFIINGLDAKRVLVQAGGPALTALNVANALADPQLRVHASNGAVIAQNDNWNNDPAVTLGAQQTGASRFALNSLDAATVLTLEPGGYTVVVSGVNGATGNALVEVYELP